MIVTIKRFFLFQQLFVVLARSKQGHLSLQQEWLIKVQRVCIRKRTKINPASTQDMQSQCRVFAEPSQWGHIQGQQAVQICVSCIPTDLPIRKQLAACSKTWTLQVWTDRTERPYWHSINTFGQSNDKGLTGVKFRTVWVAHKMFSTLIPAFTNLHLQCFWHWASAKWSELRICSSHVLSHLHDQDLIGKPFRVFLSPRSER